MPANPVAHWGEKKKKSRPKQNMKSRKWQVIKFLCWCWCVAFNLKSDYMYVSVAFWYPVLEEEWGIENYRPTWKKPTEWIEPSITDNYLIAV